LPRNELRRADGLHDELRLPAIAMRRHHHAPRERIRHVRPVILAHAEMIGGIMGWLDEDFALEQGPAPDTQAA